MKRHTAPLALVAAVMLFDGWAGAAAAQEESRPPELVILQDFGTNGRLTLEGMRRYLRSESFDAIDANQDEALDEDEYTVARLYARPGSCGSPSDAIARFKEDREKAGGALTAEALAKGNRAWELHFDEMTRAHWQRAGGTETTPGLDLAAIRAYLKAERTRQSPQHTVATRMEALEKKLGKPLPQEIPEQKLKDHILDERFKAVDSDGSNVVDLLEFGAAFPTSDAVAEFCALAGDDFLVSRDEFVKPNPQAPHLQRALAALFPFVGPVALNELRMRWKEEEDEAAAAVRLRGLPPHGYVPGYGFLVRGARKVQKKTVGYDADQTTIFLRIIKDFTVDDPTTAEPATFSINKEKGKAATIAMDAAFQVDFKPAAGIFEALSLGIDVERNTARDPQVHRQRYYGTVDFFSFHPGQPIESHALRLAPYLENDDRKDVRRLGGSIIWTPGLHLGSFLTSQWRPIGPRANWYVVPRLVVDLAQTVGENETEPDGGHFRVEMLWGFAAGRFNSTFKAFRRRGFEEQLRSSHFEELSAWWNVDELKRFSIKATASWGKATHTDAANKTAVSAGFGLKF